MGSTPNTTKKCRIYGQGAGVGGSVDKKLLRGHLWKVGGSLVKLTGVLLKAVQPSPGAWWKMNQIPLGGESDTEDGDSGGHNLMGILLEPDYIRGTPSKVRSKERVEVLDQSLVNLCHTSCPPQDTPLLTCSEVSQLSSEPHLS